MGDDNWKAAKRRLVKRKKTEKTKRFGVWWCVNGIAVGLKLVSRSLFSPRKKKKKKVALRVHNPAASALEESRKRREKEETARDKHQRVNFCSRAPKEFKATTHTAAAAAAAADSPAYNKVKYEGEEESKCQTISP